ncbi:MAG TPA: hypothetical protein VF713_23975 [Thermoanaerobaculia bacterium]
MAATDVFFSCSFHDADAPVNSIVRTICESLQLRCVNVAGASGQVPPAKAKEMISSATGLVAVAVRRDRLADGAFRMPDAVHDEISIAFGLGKPVLLLAERDVKLDGFLPSYGTFLQFDRDNLNSPDVIGEIVASIHGFKMELAPAPQQAANNYFQGQEYHSEVTHFLSALQEGPNGYTWTSATTKRLRFNAPFSREIFTGAWAGVPVRMLADAPNMEWEFEVTGGSKRFEATITPRIHNPAAISLAIRLSPDPEPGDFVEFNRISRSRYLNATFKDDLDPIVPILDLNGKKYLAHDGFVVVEPTLQLRAQFRVPRKYRLSADEIAVFVASHSDNVDYLIPSELARIKHRVESFAGEIVADIDAPHPFLGHIYGFAWNPPARPA